MPRFDISRLRKAKGMSQSELAQLLQMTQSFLSAIENGKSPLPIEKEERLCEIFGLTNLKDYILEDKKIEEEDTRLTEMTDSDLFNQLLSRFHKQAHNAENEHHHHNHHKKIEELETRMEGLLKRIDALMQRNDSLLEDNDRLRKEIDTYRREIEQLRADNYHLRTAFLGK